ncbi:MAG: shikimate kinase [Candidatus Fonsibacter sp.]|nr:shikimate kinase [Candidatus Fonsibacter sp.]
MATHKSLVLVGMMGTGKSTIGKEVAKKLKVEFIDTDELIEKEENVTISEIFKKNGEKYFRELEEKIFLKIKDDKEKIISIGGGAFINDIIRKKILKEYLSIWLNVDEDLIISRIKRNAKKRPMVDQNNIEKSVKNLKKTRDPIYKLANYEIDCNLNNKNKIIEKIIDFYEKNNN